VLPKIYERVMEHPKILVGSRGWLMVVAVAFALGRWRGVGLGQVLFTPKTGGTKTPFTECGLESKGDAGFPSGRRYYLYAIIFLVSSGDNFFLLPFAVRSENSRWGHFWPW